jgi:hypothetical protein
MALDATTSIGNDAGMSEKFSDQLRRAVRESEVSRYAISKTTGIDQATLSRFVAGAGGMSLESIDKLMDALNFEIRPRKRGRKLRGIVQEARRELVLPLRRRRWRQADGQGLHRPASDRGTGPRRRSESR